MVQMGGAAGTGIPAAPVALPLLAHGERRRV
jgi:hypothetical protein